MQINRHTADTAPFRLRSPDLEALQTKHDELAAIIRDSARAWRKATLAHRLLTDLIARRGGNEQERAYVVKKLAEIEAG